MNYKPDVIRDGICEELIYALDVADKLHKDITGVEMTVTSLRDGQHNPGSLHPIGRAADLRTKDMDEEHRKKWYDGCKTALYHLGFDVIWEGCKGATPATTAAHMHLEFDPKPGREFHRD
jgi:hypothetical protein